MISRRSRWATAGLAAILLVGPLASARAARAADEIRDTGFLRPPFREDGAPFDRATGTFGGQRGDDGCTVDTPQADRTDCLPAAASQTLLADSRVLYWNAIEGSEQVDGPAALQGGDLFIDDQSRVLTLDYGRGAGAGWLRTGTGAFPGTPREPPLIPGLDPENPNAENDASLFCSDQKLLFDGRVMAVGGTNYYSEPRVADRLGLVELEGARNARAFDPGTNSWSKLPDMLHGRWYPSMVTLPNGDVFVASGVTKLIKPLYPTHFEDSGTNVRQTETYTASSAAPQFVDNGRAADRSLPLFPRLHLLPNGHVYYDAAGQSFNPAGQSYDQVLWNEAAVYDPSARIWSGLGVPGITTAELSTAEPGFRGSTFSQMLTLRPGTDGRYAVARFLSAGGVLGGSPGSYVPVASARINAVSMDSDGAETLDTFDAGALHRPRWYPSATVLPNGQVFVSGGADVDEVITPGAESPITQTEIFTPGAEGTGGEWRLGPVLDRGRTYHNTSMLLPTGQVLIGGHAPIPNGYGPVSNNPDTPARDFSNNFKDASFQIYTPPNLSRGYERPVIERGMADRLDHGSRVVIPTRSAGAIHSVVLARNSSVTHLIDGDQRMVELPIISRDRNSVTVRMPGPNVLPRGPYQLFINRDAVPGGPAVADELVPSVARQVFVGVNASRGIRSLPQTSQSPARP